MIHGKHSCKCSIAMLDGRRVLEKTLRKRWHGTTTKKGIIRVLWECLWTCSVFILSVALNNDAWVMHEVSNYGIWGIWFIWYTNSVNWWYMNYLMVGYNGISMSISGTDLLEVRIPYIRLQKMAQYLHSRILEIPLRYSWDVMVCEVYDGIRYGDA